MAIKVVFFDMGGTIETYQYDRDLRIQRAYLIREALINGGIILDLTDEQLADTVTRGIKAYHIWNMASRNELPPVQVWKDYILKEYAIPEETLAPIAETLSVIYETQFYERRMRPEIPEVLAGIQSLGLSIGCISNVHSRGQVPQNLIKYGIIDFFNPIVLSSEYGRRKPDPSIFHYAARMAGVPTSACVYVGDKINRDIVGAKQAGFRLAVQIRHIYDDGEPDVGATPDVIIKNMQELLPVLTQAMDKDQSRAAALAARPVKALFFDAGDILYTRPNRDAYLHEFLAQNTGLPQSNHQTEKIKALKELAFIGAINRRQFQTRLLNLYGIEAPTLFQAGIAAIEKDEQIIEIIPGVPETLQVLKKQGFLLGVITDTALPVYMKLDWFQQAGFGNVWDSFITSIEIGAHKPAALIYQKAIEQLGVSADQCVFVGHQDYELEGARAVGMHTVAYHYARTAKAEYFISHFEDLLKLPFVSQYEVETIY